MLATNTYREKVFAELGIAPVSLDPENNADDRKAFYSMIVAHIAGNRSGLPVYVAVTAAGGELTERIKDKLYLAGLAYLYTDGKPDNIALLKRNFERRFALDYLTTSFRTERFQAIVDQANGNYIVPMLHLYEHYRVSGEEQKAAALKEKAILVSRKAGFEQEVQDYFLQPEHRP